MIRPLLAALGLLLVFATPAMSAIPAGWQNRADAVSRSYWKQATKCPLNDWDVSRTPPAWLTAYGPADTAVAGADYNNCIRWIDEDWIPFLTYQQFCVITVHEYGHSIGLEHPGERRAPTLARDPLNVMFPAANKLSSDICDPPRRLEHRKQDRTWCLKHERVCAKKYPYLARHVGVR